MRTITVEANKTILRMIQDLCEFAARYGIKITVDIRWPDMRAKAKSVVKRRKAVTP